jgi:hypothetical protein
MTPGDIVLWRDKKFGVNRAWEVQACNYGALGQEGLIELKAMFETPGRDVHGTLRETVVVPECLLRDLECFSKQAAHG